MTQASDAMNLAASTGMTLKEAWAQIKGEAVTEAETSSPAASSDDDAAEKKLDELVRNEEAF